MLVVMAVLVVLAVLVVAGEPGLEQALEQALVRGLLLVQELGLA